MKKVNIANITGALFIILGALSIAYPFYSSLGIEAFLELFSFLVEFFTFLGVLKRSNVTATFGILLWEYCTLLQVFTS